MAQTDVRSYFVDDKGSEESSPKKRKVEYEDISPEKHSEKEFGTGGAGPESHDGGRASTSSETVKLTLDSRSGRSILEWLQQAGWNPPGPSQAQGQAGKPDPPPSTCSGAEGQEASLDGQSVAPPGTEVDWTQDTGFSVSDSEQPDEDEDWLDEATRFYSSEESLGEDLPKDAATLANKALRSAVPASREKELMEKFLRPRNCEGLIVPRVNQDIWKVLQRRTRDADFQLQKVHSLLNKGLIPILQTLASLKGKKDKDNLKRVLDAFQLLALGSHSLAVARRQAMQPDLFPQFRALCAPSRPVGELLFGEDQELTKAMKQLKESQQADTRLGYGAPRPTFRGRGTGGYRGGRGGPAGQRGKTRPNFLGGRAPPYRRRGANNNNNYSRGQQGHAAPQKQGEQK